MENKFDEKLHWYSTSECNEVLNVRAMDQEIVSLDPVIFQSANTKMP